LLSALGTNLAFLFKHRGAVAAPDVDMRHPLRSAVYLFRSNWWSIGWGVAVAAFALHVAALTLAPISIGQAVLAGGLVFLAVLAERFFGFELGRRQWIGIGLVAVSLALLTLTGGGGVLGLAAGLGFGISDVAIKALSGDLDSGPIGLLSPWTVVIVTAAVFSFYASARSLQIGDGVAVIAVTSVAANLSTATRYRPRGRRARRRALLLWVHPGRASLAQPGVRRDESTSSAVASRSRLLASAPDGGVGHHDVGIVQADRAQLALGGADHRSEMPEVR
jgi:drug/metabolite transporter (DMT)-like permease